MSETSSPPGAAPQTTLLEYVRLWTLWTLPVFLGGWIYWQVSSPCGLGVDRSGTPLGGDYLAFYTAGRMVLDGDLDQLYDEAAQQERFSAILPHLPPGSCRLPYRYPPIFAVAMAPLAALPFAVSYLVFSLLSLLALAAAIRALQQITRALPGNDPRVIAWWTAGWPIVLENLSGGQLTFFGTAIAAVALSLLARGALFHAGLVGGLTVYKPNLLLLLWIGCVIRQPRMLAGLAVTGTLVAGLQLAAVGWDVSERYLELGQQLALQPWTVEAPPLKVHGLAPWLALLVPGLERKLLLAIGIAGALAIGGLWRRTARTPENDAWAISTLVLWNCVGNPYLPVYDLTLLVIPTGLLLGLAGRTSTVTGFTGAWLVLLTIGPHLSQAVAARTGLQVFPAVLVMLFVAAALGWRRSLSARKPSRDSESAVSE